MANGFGLNAAVQAFPSAYEFGRSLVGQDNASLERAFKQKLLTQELAQKQQQLDDEAAYRAEQMRVQDYANQTQRMATEGINNYHLGTLGVQQQLAPSQIDENRARADSLSWGVREGQQKLPGQLRFQDVQNQYYGGMTDSMAAKTVEQKMQNKEREDEDAYGAALPKLIDDPFNADVTPEQRRRFMTEAGIMANPAAEKAISLIDAAQAEYAKTGKQDLFNDELKQATGAALQPLIDQNTGSAPGSFRFAGFEQVPGGVTMRLQKVDPKSGQPLSTEPVYVTNGRVPMAEGGVPTVFSAKDVRNVMAGLRSAADWQRANPELAQDMQDMAMAHTGAHDASTYARNRVMLSTARYKSAKDDASRARMEQKDAERLRMALVQDAIKRIDSLSGYSEKDFVETDPKTGQTTRNTAAVQNAMKLRQKAMAEVSRGLKGATLEQLMGITADEIIGSNAVAPLVNEFVNSARPMGSGPGYVPPSTGGIQNSSAYGSGNQPAAGGQPGPFPPRP
jgi:hypothetical protein